MVQNTLDRCDTGNTVREDNTNTDLNLLAFFGRSPMLKGTDGATTKDKPATAPDQSKAAPAAEKHPPTQKPDTPVNDSKAAPPVVEPVKPSDSSKPATKPADAAGKEATKPAEAKEKGDDRHHHKREKPDAKSELSKDLPPEANLKNGDIVFVSNSNFEEGKAIQAVSKSPLTHCGILFKEDDKWYVYEAVQPIKKTPLKDFHKTDGSETYLVRRLKHDDIVLTKDVTDKLHKYLKSNEGKDYDHLFGWGNDKMYCSELVWKAYYEAARVKVGQIKMVGDYDLSDPVVKKQVELRYGKAVPVTEPTITPGGVYESKLLKTVK